MNVYKIISKDVKSKISEIPEFQGLVPAALLDNVAIEIPKIRDFGDYSTNVAMILAKVIGKSPRDVAEIIIPHLQEISYFKNVSIAGPGFINMTATDGFILESAFSTGSVSADEKSMVIDLDYGAYNVAKSLHIGHLRTGIVGDTFNRIAKFLGHKTFSWNHMGDWGRPMALVIAWIERLYPQLPYFQPDFDPANPVVFEMDKAELNGYYPAASALAKEDPDFLAHVHDIKVKFQDGHPGYFALYEKFLKISMDMMDDVVKKLNMMPFDYNLGERNAAQYLPQVEEILREKNLLVESDGAMVIELKRDDDRAPMPPYMWTDSRGADTYDSTDLATVYCRKITDNPDRIIYFTDVRQQLHFQQLFRAAEMSGIFPSQKMEHLSFGTINGTDGRPYKTRDGGAAGLDDIINVITDAARARVVESGKDLPESTVDMIALAALKFNDLTHDVKSDYIFDVDAVTSFEGRTGPYILYTAVRLQSIMKKVGDINENLNTSNFKLSPDERNLLLIMLDFDRMINTAFERRGTYLLANYAYDLCQAINTFYHNCPILRDDVDADTKKNRLMLVKQSFRVLATAIDLMGLRIPDQM